MKRSIFKLSVSICIISMFLVMISSAAYTDVPASHWAYASIEAMTQKGVIKGAGDNLFKPENALTRAEFITVVTRAILSDQIDAVVKEPWYAANYKVALDAELIREDETPNTVGFMSGNITRYEMARLLVRADENVNKNPALTADQSTITDYMEIPIPYHYFVEQAYAKGLLTGDGFGRFCGSENMTRAQAAVVVERLLKSAETEPPYDRDEFLAEYQRMANLAWVYPTRMPELGEHTEQYLAFMDAWFPRLEFVNHTMHYRLLDAETQKPLPYAPLYIWAYDNADIDNVYFVMPIRSDRNGEITFTLKRKPTESISYLLCGADRWEKSNWSTNVTVGEVKYEGGLQGVGLATKGNEVIELLFSPELT